MPSNFLLVLLYCITYVLVWCVFILMAFNIYLFSFCSNRWFNSVFFMSTFLWIFQFFFYYKFPVLYHCNWKKILDIFSVLLNFLWFVLWTNMWYVLENILCTLEKNVIFCCYWWNVLYMSVYSIGLKAEFSIISFELKFCKSYKFVSLKHMHTYNYSFHNSLFVK